MANPVLVAPGSLTIQGPSSIGKELGSGKYYVLTKTDDGAFVHASSDNGVTWALSTTLLWTDNNPIRELIQNPMGLCVDPDDKVIVLIAQWTLNGSNYDWTFQWKKKTLGGSWSAAFSSPVLVDYSYSTSGPICLTIIPVQADSSKIHVTWASVDQISGSNHVRWFSYILDTSSNIWTSYTQHLNEDYGTSTPQIVGIQAVKLNNSTHEWGGLLSYTTGTSNYALVRGFTTNASFNPVVNPVRFTGDGISFPWRSSGILNKGFSLCGDPSLSKIHSLYVSISSTGLYDSFIHQVFTFTNDSVALVSVDSTQSLYRAPSGASVEAGSLALSDDGYLHAIMQAQAPAQSPGDEIQNVFAITSKLLSGGGWDTIDVWENLKSSGTGTVFSSFGVSTINVETSGVALVWSSKIIPVGDSALTVPGTYFQRLPRTFSYEPWAFEPSIFPTGIDVSPSPPIPSPPTTPPQTEFIPGPCIGSYREVIKPSALSEESDGWFGGITSLNDSEEIGDNSESYITGDLVGGILGLEFNPPTLEPIPGEQAMNLQMRVLNATATVKATFQYMLHGSSVWVDLTYDTFSLTEEFLTYSILGDLPEGIPLSFLRLKLQILTFSPDANSTSRIELTQAAFAMCGDFKFIPPSPPIAEELLQDSIQSPPIPGPAEFPLIEVSGDETGGHLLPPGPPSSSLPPGTEILRPNRDVLVRLFHPRSLYMRLNEPISNPTDDPIYAPLLLERYSETSGELVETLKPHFEVALTDPRTLGPWDHIQVRFRAARSRAPQEILPIPLPEPECQLPALTECPEPLEIGPVGVEENGDWQRAPLQWAIDESLDKPDGCHIHGVVTDPPGRPCRIIMNTVPNWDGGYSKITVKARARARAAREDLGSRYIQGFSANTHEYNKVTASMPPGTPDYQVQWNPLSCDGPVQAWKHSETEMRGTGVLSTNIDIHATLYIAAQAADNILVEVSADGVNYAGNLEFNLKAFTTSVVHYRVVLNQSNPTPLGNHPLGLVLQISGPTILTPHDLISDPSKASFIISVAQGAFKAVPLTSRVRLRVRPVGNSSLTQQPSKVTVTLTESWVTYDISWKYLWSSDLLRDLRFELLAEALELSDDVANIDVDVLAAEVEYYCPGLSPLVEPPPLLVRDVLLEPVEDVSNSGWSKAPLWSRLIGDPYVQASDFIEADPTKPNGFMVGMGNSDLARPLAVGYRREWTRIEVLIQADIESLGSTKAILDVSSNFGASKRTPELINTSLPYSLIWDYQPGLTTEQIDRVKIAIKAIPVTVGKNKTLVKVRALNVRAYADDILISTGESAITPILPLLSSPVIALSEVIEVFSCGSLGISGTSPQRRVTTITVRNEEYVGSANLDMIMTGNLNWRFQGESHQVLTEGEVRTIELYAHVGSVGDPYPVFSTEGVVEVVLTQGSKITRKTARWFYNGNV